MTTDTRGQTNNPTIEGAHEMSITLDRPRPLDQSAMGRINARKEPIFLRGEGFELTARQIVLALAAHLARFGDNFDPRHIDAPLWAIDAHMRFDGDLTAWALDRTTTEVALLLARAERIALDYFGHKFPALPW